MCKLPPCREEEVETLRLNTEIKDALHLQEIHYCGHFRKKFQEHIEEALIPKHDFVWFLGCTHPWYVITKSDSYIHNFRSILKDDGCVVYSDGWSRDQPSDGWSLNKLDVFGWKECTATVLDKTRDLPQKIREQLEIEKFDGR